MRATEIIRSLLDILDQLEDQESECLEPVAVAEFPPELIGYSNTPDPLIADVASVTTAAGGGLNGPKNPADLRSDSVSMYPNFQAKF